jgi:hypothetical protein
VRGGRLGRSSPLLHTNPRHPPHESSRARARHPGDFEVRVLLVFELRSIHSLRRSLLWLSLLCLHLSSSVVHLDSSINRPRPEQQPALFPDQGSWRCLPFCSQLRPPVILLLLPVGAWEQRLHPGSWLLESWLSFLESFPSFPSLSHCLSPLFDFFPRLASQFCRQDSISALLPRFNSPPLLSTKATDGIFPSPISVSRSSTSCRLEVFPPTR